MHMGYFTHVAGHGRAADAYRNTIELAVLAERLGFHSFWLAQHHGRAAAGWLPSPLVLLAAIAEHTTSIRLGTAVIAAPLENPRRLAEDAAVLDALSGGRLQLGLGAGSDAEAAATFGLEYATRHFSCLDVVDQVCALLTGDELVPAAEGLRGRLWWATSSRDMVDAAAARGIGLISGRPPEAPGGERVPADLARYWTRAVDKPRVAVSRVLTGEQTRRDLVDRLVADPALHWADELIVQTQPPGAALDAQRDVMRMLGEQVAPALSVALARRGQLVPV